MSTGFLLPERIGRYRIEQVLGEGAMGVVYKAVDTVLERAVALKLVRTELLSAEERADYLTRFKREAQAAARFHHPNIVAVYDFAEHEGAPYIAMEYVVGKSLRDLFREQGKLAPRQAGAIALQMLAALGAVHSVGVVHRDMKPANVIVVAGGVVKLADFGVARIEGSELTMDGSMIGTAGYMSPEQYKGERVDARSDLFSTGVILYEVIAGQKPFNGNSLPEVLYKTVYEAPPDIATLAAVSPALKEVISRSLGKAPADRFQTAEEFAAALKSALEQPEAPLVSGETVTNVAPSRPQPATEAVTDAQPVAAQSAAAQPAAAAPVAEAPSAVPEPPSLPTSPSAGAGPATAAVSERARAQEPSVVGQAFTPERLQAAERALAFHLGPIAKVMVKKAAAQSQSLADFHARLAGNLPREADKAAFLAAVKKG